MRYFYTFLFYLAVPFIFLRLWWRSRKAKDYGRRWRERFAFLRVPKEWQHGLWVHAVSVGEVLAAVPLVKAIHLSHPDLPIVMTTMTPTGSARVKANFSDSVFHCYVPYDIPSVVKRFLKQIKPRALMLLETELWPNILYLCKQRKIPVMMANARLSEKSYRGYARFPKSTHELLSAITLLGAHAKDDAERFIKLGINPKKVVVTGSIKFEIKVPASILEQAEVLRIALGQNRPIWIAASTHEGEDEKILAAHKIVLEHIPNALLVLTPRHPERFREVYQLSTNTGLKTIKRSNDEPCSADIQVYIGDTMGELLLFFAAVDLAFIGGSLVNHGGHNLLEPASLGLASITGPANFNFAEISRMMFEAKASSIVHNSDELAQEVVSLLQNSSQRTDMGERGHRVIEANKGALAAHMLLFKELDIH